MVIKAVLTVMVVFAVSAAPSFAQIVLGEDIVVITAPDGATITGEVCNYTTEVCVKIAGTKGTIRTNVPIKHGDLVGFSGLFDQASVDIVKGYSNRGEFKWLENMALVIAGAIGGIISNLLMGWNSDQRKDYIEQRAKFRSWRDAMNKQIKERESDSSVKFIVDIPKGLSKKTGKKINDLQNELIRIENELHARPAQAKVLLSQARQLLLESSA